MNKNTVKNTILMGLLLIGLTACDSGGSSRSKTELDGILAGNMILTIAQNNRTTVDLPLPPGVVFELLMAPNHGKIMIDQNRITYRATQPLYSGSDFFTYQLRDGTTISNEATANVTITPVANGTVAFNEKYTGGDYVIPGWNRHTSDFGHLNTSEVTFSNTTFNGVASSSRRFAIIGDNSSYAGDAFYNSFFNGLPVDGAAGPMHDWPWKAELLHQNQCGADTTIIAKITPRNGKYPMGAILLNYDIETRTTGEQKLTGYQLLFNAGGGSLTLSRFENENAHATAFLDRWPNTNYGNEAMANPVVGGPYKGWNYRNGVWPAGGNIGTGGEFIVAVNYKYNTVAKSTTISFEARAANGTDLTPGFWDEVVTLIDGDSLSTGGSFGLMGLNYHTDSMILDTDFDISEFNMVCSL